MGTYEENKFYELQKKEEELQRLMEQHREITNEMKNIENGYDQNGIEK